MLEIERREFCLCLFFMVSSTFRFLQSHHHFLRKTIFPNKNKLRYGIPGMLPGKMVQNLLIFMVTAEVRRFGCFSLLPKQMVSKFLHEVVSI